MSWAWRPNEIRAFLDTTDREKAKDLASWMGRSIPAIMGMRRKLKRPRELGVEDRREHVQLLQLNDGFIQRHDLAAIRRRAEIGGIEVKPFLRRGRLYGRPRLVTAHSRRPQRKR